MADPDPAPFTFAQPVTLLGAATTGARTLETALSRAPRLVAVDGGADVALRLGRRPERVIGDLDSISDRARAELADRLTHVADQDDTDFDKALDRVEAPLLLALGFSGGRMDHTLAVLSGLARRPDRTVILFAGRQIAFVVPPRLDLCLPAGCLVSLYPLSAVACDSTGLEWPTDGLRFVPGGRLGTSNRATGAPITLAPSAPAMLGLLPSRALDAAIAGLSAAQPWRADARAQ